MVKYILIAAVIAAGIAFALRMNGRKTSENIKEPCTLLGSLTQAMQESDPSYREHVSRTSALGKALAERLNFTESQKSDLAMLCQLHDMGKLGVSMDIVNKPGRLTEYEWSIIRTHAEKGYNIAKASENLADLADAILYHHEWWDGSGYPDGLKHESIPLLSRVIAIIDAYDAMTTNKPYHDAMSQLQARDEIRRCAGTQFDPFLASEFLQMVDELYPVSEEEETAPDAYSKFEFVKVDDVDSTVNNNPNVAKAVTCEYTIANDTSIILVDDNFENLTGYSFEDVKALHLTQLDLLPDEDAVDYKTAVDMQLVIDSTAFVQHRLRRKDGSLHEVVSYGMEFFNNIDKEIQARIKVISMDKTIALKKAKKEAKESAERYINRWEGVIRKDSLTGIFNHEAFVSEVETLIMESNSGGVFVMLDVDNFKNFNDTHGHMAGDILLQSIAASLKDVTSEHGIAGRLGGDEFAAYMSLEKAQNDPEEARRLATLIFDSVSKTARDNEHSATISMGAVYCGKELNTFRSMYGAADKALYYSKDSGKNKFTLMFSGE